MATVARAIEGYSDLVEVCRARANELKITRLEIDEIGGLTPGHSSKLLSPSHLKMLGDKSFPKLFKALGLTVFVLEDEKATAATLKRRTPKVMNRDHGRVRSKGSRDAAA